MTFYQNELKDLKHYKEYFQKEKKIHHNEKMNNYNLSLEKY